MEFIIAILTIIWFLIKLSFMLGAPIFLVSMILHSAIFNRWNYNFSKEGFFHELKVFCVASTIMVVGGLGLMAIFSIIKSWFTE